MERRPTRHPTRQVVVPGAGAAEGGREDPRFVEDDRGQLLILTGVLLVLGFVTIGATLVQVQTLDETTSRQSRDNLLDSYDDLLTKFNQTLGDGAFLGETDVGQFQDFAARAESQMRDGATKRGIYLTVEPDTDPPMAFYQRESRCYAFDSMKNGVITSYELNSRDESIVGAVYDIYASDGIQSIQTKYYVKLYDCLMKDTSTYVDSIETHYGTAQRFYNATQEGDDPAAMTVKEEFVEGSSTTVETGVLNVASGQPWSVPTDALVADDDVKASRPVSESGSGVTFNLDIDDIDTGAVFHTVQIRVIANGDENIVDDSLELFGTYNGDEVGPYAISVVPLLGTESTTTILVTNPTGALTWTHEELANTEWLIEYKKVLEKDNSGTLYIEKADAEVEYTLDRHDLEVDFEFDRIPDLFSSHTLEVRYRMAEENTTGEEFYFQIYDPVADTWRTAGDPIAYTDGTWQQITEPLVGDEYPATGNQRPLFRVIDSDSGDHVQLDDADLDYIEFDYVRVNSIYD